MGHEQDRRIQAVQAGEDCRADRLRHRTLETDKSGDTLVERIDRDGHVLADRAIVTDDVEKIRAQVKKWIDDPKVEAVITTGGTGVTGRDVTPEALEGLFEKRIEGFGEVFRWISFQKIGTSTMQSRAIAGRRQRNLHLRPAGLDRRLQGRLGRHLAPAARHPLPPLQLRRADAAPERRQDAAQWLSLPERATPVAQSSYAIDKERAQAKFFAWESRAPST